MKLSEFKKRLKELEDRLLIEYGLTDEELKIKVINSKWHYFEFLSELEFDEEDTTIYLD